MKKNRIVEVVVSMLSAFALHYPCKREKRYSERKFDYSERKSDYSERKSDYSERKSDYSESSSRRTPGLFSCRLH